MRYAACFFCLALWLRAGCRAEALPDYHVRLPEPGGPSGEEGDLTAKAGTSDAIRIEKISATGMSARPAAEQPPEVKKEAVSDAVLNAMTSAPVVEPKESIETVYRYPYSYPYYYGYGYGYPYYGPYYGYGAWYGSPYYGYYHHYPY